MGRHVMGSEIIGGNEKSTIYTRLSRLPKMAARLPMLLVFAALSFGSTFASLLGTRLLTNGLVTAICLLSILLACLLIRWKNFETFPKRHEFSLVLIALIGILLVGSLRSKVENYQIECDRLHNLADDQPSPVVLEGVIESVPRWKPDTLKQRSAPDDIALVSDDLWQTIIDVRVTGIRYGNIWKHERYGLIRVTSQGRSRKWLPGDKVRCLLEWQRIKPPTNPGQSDYAKRSSAEGIFVRGRTDVMSQIEVLPGADLFRLDRYIGKIVIVADQLFHRFVPLGQARMASALVLGQREQAEWELQESMLATGTIHMLAISGMHIELVAVSILSFGALIRLHRKTSLAITMLLVVIYSLVAGANPPVMRAAIFVVVICIARWIGRPMQSMNVLAFAAVVLLVYKTNNLLDIGTQLSFIAVTILIFLGSNRESMVSERDSLNDLLLATSHPVVRFSWYIFELATEMLKVSGWVWLLTAPLTLYYFNIVSPIACLLNVLLWIPIFVSLLAGILLLMVGSVLVAIPWLGSWLVAAVGYPLGFLCASGLFVTDRIVKACEQIPIGHLWLPSPTWFFVVIFYLLLVIFITVFGFEKNSRRWIVFLTCIWLITAACPLLDRIGKSPFISDYPDSTLWTTFVDVGHGTCVMIELPDSQIWLYDAGRMGDVSKSHLQISSVLWYQNRTRIDKVFLSHADSDHFCAIAGLSKRFQIGEVCTTQQALQSQSKGMQELFAVLKSRSIPITTIDADTDLDRFRNNLGDVDIDVLHPDCAGVVGNDNANSMCLVVQYAGKKLFLPGDLEGAGTKKLLEQSRTSIDVLMAPHHGSLSTNPAMMLTWCQPSVVAISGGSKTRSDKVRTAFSAPGRELLITANDNAFRIGFQWEKPLIIERWKHPSWISTSHE